MVVENKRKIFEEFTPEGDPDVLNIYFNQISRWSLLDKVQEKELGIRIKKGTTFSGKRKDINSVRFTKDGLTAFYEIVGSNLRFAAYVANRPIYRNSDYLFTDRIQDGNIGLMNAAVKFNPNRGTRFTTHAWHWINQAVSIGVSKHENNVRIPGYLQGLSKQAIKIADTLYFKLGRDPSYQEISDVLKKSTSMQVKITPSLVRKLLKVHTETSIDQAINDGNNSLLDLIASSKVNTEKTAENEIVRDELGKLLERELKPKEERILRLRYGLNDGKTYTLDEIGKKIGVSRERIRQIEKESIENLSKNPSRAKYLRSLLDYDEY